jgi:hypothetical protein
VTPAELRAWVAETLARQGFPPTISDPAVLAELAALVADTMVLGRQRGGDRARSA